MEKDKLLSVNQNEKRIRDEREEVIEKTSNNYGLIVALLLSLGFSVFNLLYNLPIEPFSAIFWGYMAGSSFKSYKTLDKSKMYLLICFLSATVTIISIIMYGYNMSLK